MNPIREPIEKFEWKGSKYVLASQLCGDGVYRNRLYVKHSHSTDWELSPRDPTPKFLNTLRGKK